VIRSLMEKLERELNELQHEMRHELPKEINKAKALGDLRENAEYQMALERQKFVQARIGQLAARLSELSSVNVNAIPRDKVGLGSTVTLIDLATNSEIVYELVMSDSGDVATGKISVGSPIGRGLVGRQEGDEVEIQIPSGKKKFEIVKLVTLHDKSEVE
jgi:transcription elongation factor GreA